MLSQERSVKDQNQPKATVLLLFGVWHGCKVFGKRLIDQGTPAAIYNTGSENSFEPTPTNNR